MSCLPMCCNTNQCVRRNNSYTTWTCRKYTKGRVPELWWRRCYHMWYVRRHREMEGPQPKESKRCLWIYRMPELLRPGEACVPNLSRDWSAEQQGTPPSTRCQAVARQNVQRQDIARFVNVNRICINPENKLFSSKRQCFTGNWFSDLHG